MQLAEEKQSGWLQVPRIGYYAFAITDIRGGANEAHERMENAIKAARRQWANGVAPHVEMISEVFEPLEGELWFNEWGGVEGPARATFPDGNVYEGNYKGGRRHGQGTAKWASGDMYVGQFENDKKHGRGTFTFANGDMYVGQFENDKRHGRGTFTWPNGHIFEGDFQNDVMHGRGTFTWADGDVAALIFQEDRPKGPGVRLEKASGLFWLLKGNQAVQQISEAEARSSFFGRFKLRFMLAPGQRGGEGARPAGTPLVTALHVMSALFSDCKGRRSHPKSSKLSSKSWWGTGRSTVVDLWQALPSV